MLVSAGVTALLILLLVFANFSYNRGFMLAPIIGVLAAYSAHVRRLSLAFLVLAGTIALAAVFTFGWYRSTDLQIAEVSRSDLGETWNPKEVVDFVQIYASGPQMAAYMIDERGPDSSLYYGETLFASLMHPVPVVGKSFREHSGVTIFNMLIYGDPDVIDQIIPYDAELYMNLGIPGVIVGYALLGWLVSIFQRRFLQAVTPVECCIWLLVGFWTVFPGSLAVASQMYVYFFWPIYIYVVAKLTSSPNSSLGTR